MNRTGIEIEKQKKDSKKKILRVLIYGLGIFIFALGVAFSIKSNLGISPVSSVPYVLSQILGYTVGIVTAFLFIGFILLQWALLKKKFRKRDFLQLVFAVVFGSFVDLSLFLLQGLEPDSLVERFLYLLIGTLLVALGIYFMIRTDIAVSPGDGLVRALAIIFHLPFPKVKIGFDLFCSCFSAIISLLFLGMIYGVGIGTVLCALGVGTAIDLIDRMIGKKLSLVLE